MRRWLALVIIAAALTLNAMAQEKVRIGYLVKQADEPWFQMEWKGAQKAADQYGFELIKIGIPDGEKTLTAIDNLAANKVQGFVICIPDVRLGPAVIRKAAQNNLKFMIVDDPFVDANDKVIESVPFFGMSAFNFGLDVGKSASEEIKRRGWDVNAPDFGVAVMSFNELSVIKERTDGATKGLKDNAGVPENKFYDAPIAEKMEIPTSFTAANILLTKYPGITKWVVIGGNDNSVLGAIRAMENRKLGAENVIGIGINGTDCWSELNKPNPTGFYGSILGAAPQHGFRTSEMIYKWITENAEPPMISRSTGRLITRDNFKQVLLEEGVVDNVDEIK